MGSILGKNICGHYLQFWVKLCLKPQGWGKVTPFNQLAVWDGWKRTGQVHLAGKLEISEVFHLEHVHMAEA